MLIFEIGYTSKSITENKEDNENKIRKQSVFEIFPEKNEKILIEPFLMCSGFVITGSNS